MYKSSSLNSHQYIIVIHSDKMKFMIVLTTLLALATAAKLPGKYNILYIVYINNINNTIQILFYHNCIKLYVLC